MTPETDKPIEDLKNPEEDEQEKTNAEEIKPEDDDEEAKVPENIKDSLTLLKNDLEEGLTTLPENIMNQGEKLFSNVTNDDVDWMTIKRDLPMYLKDTKLWVESKVKEKRNIKHHALKLIADFENKYENAETRAKEYEKLNTSLLKRNNDLIEKLDKVNQDRIDDIKSYQSIINDDPIRKKAVEMLNKTLEKISVETAESVKIKKLESDIASLQEKIKQPTVEEKIAELKRQIDLLKGQESTAATIKEESSKAEEIQKEIEPAEPKPWKDRVLDLITEAQANDQEIKQVDIVEKTGCDKANLNKIIARLCKDKVIKKTKKGGLKLC